MRATRPPSLRHRVVLGLWAVAAALLVLVLVGAARGGDTPAPARCTHGASSLGPVELANGKIVAGSTTAHTEACLP